MSWLLDSDVLSQPAKKAGDVRVITWIRSAGVLTVRRVGTASLGREGEEKRTP